VVGPHTEGDRREISRGLRAGDTTRAIARRLGRAPSTVARDRSDGGRPRYRAWRAPRSPPAESGETRPLSTGRLRDMVLISARPAGAAAG
jgi:IS30 family transposase